MQHLPTVGHYIRPNRIPQCQLVSGFVWFSSLRKTAMITCWGQFPLKLLLISSGGFLIIYQIPHNWGRGDKNNRVYHTHYHSETGDDPLGIK